MAFNAYTTAYYLRPSVLCTLYILFFHRGNWQYILIIHHNTYVTSRFAVNTVFEIIIIYIYMILPDCAIYYYIIIFATTIPGTVLPVLFYSCYTYPW